MKGRNGAQEGGRQMPDVGDGREGHKHADGVPTRRVIRKRGEKLLRPARVANPRELLLAALREDVVDDGRDVVRGHLVEAPRPKCGVGGGEFDVAVAVVVAAVVAHPDVVPSVGEDEGKRFFGFVDNPGCGSVKKAVLKVHGASGRVTIATMGDVLKRQDETVRSCHIVHFTRVPLAFNESLHVF